MNEIGKIIIECNEWIMPNEEQDICDKLLTKRWIEVQGEYSIYRKKEDVLTDWKKYLNNNQIEIVKEKLSKEINNYGYN